MADARRIAFGNPYLATAALAFTNFTLNASNDELYWVGHAEPGTVIRDIGVRHVATVGSPQFKFSLQGVDGASGVRDGTIKGGGSPASKVVNLGTAGWGANTWQWVTLDNTYTVPDNDNLLAFCIIPETNVDGSNTGQFTQRGSGARTTSFPYSVTVDGGRAATKTGTAPPFFGYASASKAYGWPIQAGANHAFNSGTGTADEYGFKFSIPSGWCATYKVLGIRAPVTLAAGGSTVVALYGGSDLTAANSTGATTEVTSYQSVTIDHENVSSTSNGYVEFLFADDPLPTCYADAVYRISFQPQNTNSVTVLYYSVAAAADWAALEGGQLFSKCLRLNAGNWSSDVATDRLPIELILADITAPVGGSGGGVCGNFFPGGNVNF